MKNTINKDATINKDEILILIDFFNSGKIEDQNKKDLIMHILKAADLQSIITEDNTIAFTNEDFKKLANLEVNFILPEVQNGNTTTPELHFIKTSIFHAMLKFNIINNDINNELDFARNLAQHMDEHLLSGKFIKGNEEDVHLLKLVIENIQDEKILVALINKEPAINQKLQQNYTFLHAAYVNANDTAFEIIMKHQDIMRDAVHSEGLFSKMRQEEDIDAIIKLSSNGFRMTKEFVNKLISDHPQTVNRILPNDIQKISDDNLKNLITKNNININRKAVFKCIKKGTISFLHLLYLKGIEKGNFAKVAKEDFELFNFLLEKKSKKLNKDPQFNTSFWLELYLGPKPHQDGYAYKKHREYVFDILIKNGFYPPNYMIDKGKCMQDYKSSSVLYNRFEQYGITSSFAVFSVCAIALDITAIALLAIAAFVFEIPLFEYKNLEYFAFSTALFSIASFTVACTNNLPKFVYHIADSICIYFTATKSKQFNGIEEQKESSAEQEYEGRSCS